jgi:hypothetical protein
LGVPDAASPAIARLQTKLRQLRGLATAGFASNDQHLMLAASSSSQLVEVRVDRQVLVKDTLRAQPLTPLELCLRACAIACRQSGMRHDPPRASAPADLGSGRFGGRNSP